MSEQEYPHRELPLTPAIIEWLILENFAGRMVKRDEIIAAVPGLHESRGGLSANAISITSSVKKALQNLSQRGIAENTGYGHWRFQSASPPSINASPTLAESDGTHTGIDALVEIPVGKQPAAERQIGSGAGAIYVYYLPMYAQFAKDHGEAIWACKIGRTDRDPIERILSQAATALPERPVVALVLRTCVPSEWEAALHGILTIRGRRVAGSPGTEWFMTSPDEILELAYAIDPGLEE